MMESKVKEKDRERKFDFLLCIVQKKFKYTTFCLI